MPKVGTLIGTWFWLATLEAVAHRLWKDYLQNDYLASVYAMKKT